MIKKYSYVGSSYLEDPDNLEWSRKLFERIITPVFNELGYEFLEQEKVAHIRKPFSFGDVKQLAESDFIVVDVTSNDSEVYYKLAILHILQKPVLHLMRQGAELPFRIDGIEILTVDVDNIEGEEYSKKKIIEQINLLEREDLGIPLYLTFLQQFLTVLKEMDSVKNRNAIFNLLNQFENINTSLDYAKEDLVVLSDQLVYKKQEPPPSPFIERRLAKVELMGMRKKTSLSDNRSTSG